MADLLRDMAHGTHEEVARLAPRPIAHPPFPPIVRGRCGCAVCRGDMAALAELEKPYVRRRPNAFQRFMRWAADRTDRV